MVLLKPGLCSPSCAISASTAYRGDVGGVKRAFLEHIGNTSFGKIVVSLSAEMTEIRANHETPKSVDPTKVHSSLAFHSRCLPSETLHFCNE